MTINRPTQFKSYSSIAHNKMNHLILQTNSTKCNCIFTVRVPYAYVNFSDNVYTLFQKGKYTVAPCCKYVLLTLLTQCCGQTTCITRQSKAGVKPTLQSGDEVWGRTVLKDRVWFTLTVWLLRFIKCFRLDLEIRTFKGMCQAREGEGQKSD